MTLQRKIESTIASHMYEAYGTTYRECAKDILNLFEVEERHMAPRWSGNGSFKSDMIRRLRLENHRRYVSEWERTEE